MKKLQALLGQSMIPVGVLTCPQERYQRIS